MAIATTEPIYPFEQNDVGAREWVNARDRFEARLHEPGTSLRESERDGDRPRLRLVHGVDASTVAGECTRMLGVLRCTRDAGHDHGCVFTSTSGVPDRHTRTSGE